MLVVVDDCNSVDEGIIDVKKIIKLTNHKLTTNSKT